MNNRITLVLISFGLLASAAGWALHSYIAPEKLYFQLHYYGFQAASFLGALMFGRRNKDIFRTIYGKLLIILMVMIIIGSAIKVIHWPGANGILFFSFGAVALIYSIRFLKKETKKRLDILKWLWVLAAAIGRLVYMAHWVSRDIMYISDALFWLMILEFVMSERKKGTLFEEPESITKQSSEAN